MGQLFSVHMILFKAWGYEMSYLELTATLLNIWSVWLTAKKRVLSWPIGIVAVVLTGILFYQIQLYSDLVEQVYYFVTGFIGWLAWSAAKGTDKEVPVGYNPMLQNLVYAAVIATGTIAMGAFMAHITEFFPSLKPASFAYLDAFTTVMSFAAQILMIRRRIESWYLWILVDVIGIGLYYYKGVVLIAIMYVIFLILAIGGLINWVESRRAQA
jgi:nicotinamide mononucleotide transporter